MATECNILLAQAKQMRDRLLREARHQKEVQTMTTEQVQVQTMTQEVQTKDAQTQTQDVQTMTQDVQAMTQEMQTPETAWQWECW